MATQARDFASAGASAAMKESKRHSRGAQSRAGLQLVKTVSRATESARDRHDPKVPVTQVREVPRRPSAAVTKYDDLSPEQKAFETVNFVLKTVGNRLGSAGLVSLPSLDRALTSATAAVLFSAEASPLFESLRNQAHDLILVNSVFCAIYFVGFVTARLAGTLPHYKESYTPVGLKVIEQLMHAALGEEATKRHHDENLNAYKTLGTATGLLRPTDSGPGIFPGFPQLKPSAFSPTGFLTAREHKSMVEKLVTHLTKNGFPQPLAEKKTESPGRGRERPSPESFQIKDWKFLTGDDNNKSYEVAHTDKHIGENFGRVLYWLICSAHRISPGQGVIVYHQQHIQLVRWLGDRFGFRVLGMATDLDWSGKHFDVNPKIKAMIREWLVIVPAPAGYQKQRRSKQILPSLEAQLQGDLARQQTHNSHASQQQRANTKEVRRPASQRPSRSVSFAEHDSDGKHTRSVSGSSSGMSSLQRVRTEPLRSAIKRTNANDSPPRPARPMESEIPDMAEVGKRVGDVPRPASLSPGPVDAASSRRSFMPEDGEISTQNRSKRASFAGSPKPLMMGAGLPPFVTDMTNARASPTSSGSQRSSRSFSNDHNVAQERRAVDSQAETVSLERANTVSSNGDISQLPGAIYALQDDRPSIPPVPAKSPRRLSPTSTPMAQEQSAQQAVDGARPTEYFELNPENNTTAHTSDLPPLATTAVSNLLDFSSMSPEMAAHWDEDGQAEYTGISNALVHSRRGSNEHAPSQQPPGFVDSTHDNNQPRASHDSETTATTPKAHTFQPAQSYEFSHHLTESSISSVSAAPSWPSSIASVPSSILDTPTRDFNDSTAATSMSGLPMNTKSRRKAPPPPQIVPALALYNFESEDPEEELPFEKGDQLEIIEQSAELEEDGWCLARLKNGDGKVGLAPLAYIEMQPVAAPAVSSSAGTVIGALADDTVSLWSGFNQVIGWTRFREREEMGEGSQISSTLNPYLTWTDVDANEFSSDAARRRSRSNSTIRGDLADLPDFHDLVHLSPSLEASPLPSRAMSQYEQDRGSVAGSAAPEPLFSYSQLSEHPVLREDDVDATPRVDASDIPQEARDYFERCDSVSGDTEISESESRIASFEVQPREQSRGREALATTVVANNSESIIPGPRFWDDVSGGIGSPGPATVVSTPSVRGSETDAATVVDDEASNARRDATREERAPRFWDDVSGGIGAPGPGSSCRQS